MPVTILIAIVAAAIFAASGYLKSAGTENFEPTKFAATVLVGIVVGAVMYASGSPVTESSVAAQLGVYAGVIYPLVISVIFAVVGVIGVYLLLRDTQIKAGTPETIDFHFLEKYNTEREVDDEDREKVWEYTSIGLVQTGLSENARLTAKLTESGKRLLE